MLLQFIQCFFLTIFFVSGLDKQVKSYPGSRELSFGKAENPEINATGLDGSKTDSNTNDSEENASEKNLTESVTEKLAVHENPSENLGNVEKQHEDQSPKREIDNERSSQTLERRQKNSTTSVINKLDEFSTTLNSKESTTYRNFNDTAKNINGKIKIPEAINDEIPLKKEAISIEEESGEKELKSTTEKLMRLRKGKKKLGENQTRTWGKNSKVEDERMKKMSFFNGVRKSTYFGYPAKFDDKSRLNGSQTTRKKYQGIDKRPTTPLLKSVKREPEMVFIHYETIIRSRYAKTTVIASVENRGETRDININVILPRSALITKFETTTNGKTIAAFVKDKNRTNDLPKTFAKGINVGTKLIETRDCDAVALTVKVPGDSTLNYEITYEYLLERNLAVYTVPIIIHNNMWIKDLTVKWIIQEERNLTTLQTPLIFGTTALSLDNSNDPLVCLVNEEPGRAELIWAPTIYEQKKISRQLGESKEKGVVGILELKYDVVHDDDPCGQIVRQGEYFAHFFAVTNQPSLKKHVVFILDVSDSMQGDPIKQLKSAMYYILDTLQPMDNFTLINFSDDVNIMNIYDRSRDIVYRGVGIGPDGRGKKTGKTPWPGNLETYEATSTNIKLAKKSVKNMDLRVFTNIFDALIMGFKAVKDMTSLPPAQTGQSHPEPFIVFLTDGHASDGPSYENDVILKMVENQNRNVKAIMFALGFGGEADMGLLRKFALVTNGIEKHIYKDIDAANQLVTFFQSIKAPVLKDVYVKYSPNQVITSTLTEQSIPTMHHGKETIVAGKINPAHRNKRGLYVDVTALGRDALIRCESSVESKRNFVNKSFVDIYSNTTSAALNSPGIVERIWAFQSLKQLRDKIESDHFETHQDTSCDSALRPIDKMLGICLRVNYAMPLVTNLVYDGSVIERISISPEKNVEFEETTQSDPLAQFSWIRELRDEHGFAKLPIVNRKKGRMYTYLSLSVSQNPLPPRLCTNGIEGSPSECRYLPECLDPRVLGTLQKFRRHFCRLGSYAGVCCPKLVPRYSTSER